MGKNLQIIQRAGRRSPTYGSRAPVVVASVDVDGTGAEAVGSVFSVDDVATRSSVMVVVVEALSVLVVSVSAVVVLVSEEITALSESPVG